MFEPFPNLIPLPPEVTQKLKVYAVLSLNKEVNQEIFKDKAVLSLTVAYNNAVVEMAIKEAIKIGGRNPEDYNIFYLFLARDWNQLIGGPVPNLLPDIKWPEEPLKEKKEKSIEELSAYVRYVFAQGTLEEKKVAEEVIEKFKKAV